MRLGPAACSGGTAVFFLAIGPSRRGVGRKYAKGTSVDVSNIVNMFGRSRKSDRVGR